MTFIRGQKAWNKGKPFSAETRKKMGEAQKKRDKSTFNIKGLIRPGPLNNNWNGGSSRGHKTGYYSKQYKDWRMAVFQRDGFRCQVCGVVGVYLTAHHIKSFAHYPKLRFELTNGVTLCEPCHSQTDNYKGRAKKLKKGT